MAADVWHAWSVFTIKCTWELQEPQHECILIVKPIGPKLAHALPLRNITMIVPESQHRMVKRCTATMAYTAPEVLLLLPDVAAGPLCWQRRSGDTLGRQASLIALLPTLAEALVGLGEGGNHQSQLCPRHTAPLLVCISVT